MSNVKRVSTLAVVLLLVLLVIAFVLENNQPATLSFFGWSTPPLPLALYLVMALLAGWAAGPLLSWILGRGTRRLRRAGTK